MSLEESIQQEYAQIAFEHIEDMPHRAQRLLQRALGNETLERFAHSCAARIMIPEPLSVKEAMASEHAAEWRAAMQEEIDTLTKFGCFERVSRSEAIKHGKLTRAKWVFKVKYESTGELQRFKCRLVAKGFTQVEGNDFYETFSPVFGYSSLRAIMADAAARDFQLNQWDLKSSFIQQDLDVDHMYMEVPDGFDKYLPNGQPAALHMLKSIYGLKQSSRLLHERMSKYLVKLGFRQLISDQCVFVKGEGDEQVIVCTWVDDIIMSSARHNVKAREEFDRALRDEFVMSPWTTGECDWVLNMTVKRDYKEGILHLSQPLAIEKLAEKFKLTGREGYAPHVPMAPNLKLIKPADEDIVPYSTWDYRSAVGGLLYLSLTTRPDVAQAVGVLSRFMSYPWARTCRRRQTGHPVPLRHQGIRHRVPARQRKRAPPRPGPTAHRVHAHAQERHRARRFAKRQPPHWHVLRRGLRGGCWNAQIHRRLRYSHGGWAHLLVVQTPANRRAEHRGGGDYGRPGSCQAAHAPEAFLKRARERATRAIRCFRGQQCCHQHRAREGAIQALQALPDQSAFSERGLQVGHFRLRKGADQGDARRRLHQKLTA